MSGRNLWDTIAKEVRGGPMSLSVFLIGLVALILGVIFSVADYRSSLAGLQTLEQAFNVQAAGGAWTLGAMALAPQVGQMVFLSLYSLDTSRKWALFAAAAWFVLDFVSDVQFHSVNTLFPVETIGEGGVVIPAGVRNGATIGVAAAMNIMWFSVGAELFLVAGAAIVLTLWQDAVREFILLWASFGRAIADARSDAADAGEAERRRQQARKSGGDHKPQQAQKPQKPQQGPKRQPPLDPVSVFTYLADDED